MLQILMDRLDLHVYEKVAWAKSREYLSIKTILILLVCIYWN